MLPLTPHPSSQTDLEVLPSLPPPDWACGTGPATAAAVQGPQEEVGRRSPGCAGSQESPLFPGEALTYDLIDPLPLKAGLQHGEHKPISSFLMLHTLRGQRSEYADSTSGHSHWAAPWGCVNRHGAFTFDLAVWVFPSRCLLFIYRHQICHLSDMVTRAFIIGYLLWPGTLPPRWDPSLGGPPGLLSDQSLPLPG